MIAPLLALFNRSMRVESRSIWTYLVRLLLVGLISLMLLITWMSSLIQAAPGRTFFNMLVFVNLVIIVGFGLVYFASAITEEKEEATMGLLIMTGLNPVSILLGKSTSRMITVLLLLVAQIPFTLLAVTLGGVTVTQVIAAYVCMLAFTVLLCNIALYFSVCCQRAATASLLTVIAFVCFLVFPYIMKGVHILMVDNVMIQDGGDLSLFIQQTSQGMIDMNPFRQMAQIVGIGFMGRIFSYQVWSSLAGGFFFFVLALLSFRSRTREQKVVSQGRGMVTRTQGRLSLFSAGRCWEKPLVWKDFNFLAGGKPMLIVKTLGLFMVAGIFMFISILAVTNSYTIKTDWTEVFEATGGFIMIAAIAGFAIDLCVIASRVFKSEIKWKTHSSLMTLPWNTSSIVSQKLVGSLFGTLPYFIFFSAGAVLSLDVFFEVLYEMASEPDVVLGIILVFAQFIMFLYLVAFYSLILKWGALALAFVTYFMASTTLSYCIAIPGMMLSMASQQLFNSFFPIFLIGTGISVVIIIGLHMGISRQLERAAGAGD
jgi:hypothetical protein